MCTVSFIPLNQEEFYLTSNRDENAKRSPSALTKELISDLNCIYPKDVSKSGSWILVAENGITLCLLNGGFEKHKHQPPYQKSRGIMLLEYLSFKSTKAFLDTFEFDGMEPFTFIIHDSKNLHEVRWDETKLHHTILDQTKSHIWSSCTLYTPEWQSKREQWFRDWEATKPTLNKKEIIAIHSTGGEGDILNDYMMNRNGVVQTVSITNIHKQKDSIEMHYVDLIKENEILESLVLVNKSHLVNQL